jgi:ribosomal protein S15P/S13E
MSKQPKGKKLSVPRAPEEITKDYQQTAYQAGATQYQIHVLSKELTRLNEYLERVNNEAAARNKLNEMAKQATEGAPSEQPTQQ